MLRTPAAIALTVFAIVGAWFVLSAAPPHNAVSDPSPDTASADESRDDERASERVERADVALSSSRERVGADQTVWQIEVTAAGVAVEGAPVWIVDGRVSAGTASTPGAVSGDDGRVQIAATPGTTVVCWKPPFAPLARRIPSRRPIGSGGAAAVELSGVDTSIRFELTPGHVVAGRVKLEGGDDPTIATVTVSPSLAAESAASLATVARQFAGTTVHPDDDGWFSIDGLPEGWVEVDVTAPGYWSLHDSSRRLPAQDQEVTFLLLRDAGVVEGVVVDATSRTPVSGARVWCVCEEQAGIWTSGAPVTTESDGRFRLDGVPRPPAGDAAVQIGASAPGYATTFVESANGDVLLELARACEVTVRVTGSAGGALTEARALVLDAEHREVASIPADDDGVLRFARASPDQVYAFYVSAPHHADDAVFATCGSEIVCRLEPLCVLRGTVTAGGAPPGVAGLVRLLWTYGDGQERVNRTAGIDPVTGEFEFDDVEALDGSYELTALVAGFRPARRAGIVVDSSQVDMEGVEIRLDPGIPLRGTVTDAMTGLPVVGAEVSLCDYVFDGARARTPFATSTLTDETGAFESFPLAPGSFEYGLVVDKAPYCIATRRVRVPTDRAQCVVSFELVPGASLRFRVHLADGASLDDFEIYCGGPGRRITDAVTDSGIGLLERIEPGSCEVGVGIYRTMELWMNGTQLRRSIHLTPGEVREIVFDLSAGATIRGRVTGHAVEERLPLFAWVPAEDGASFAGWREVAPDGTFVLPGVPVTSRSVAVQSVGEGYRLAIGKSVELEAGKVTEVEFHLPGGAAQFKVENDAGEPVTGAWVGLERALEGTDLPEYLGAWTGDDGVARVDALRPAEYVCRVEATGYGYEERSVPATALEVNAPALRIIVHPEAAFRVGVVDRDGGTVQPSRVHALREGLRGAVNFPADPPDEDGWRVIHNLATATYRIEIDAPGHFPHRATHAAASGEVRDLVVAMRRVGDLHVRLRAAAGQIVRGASASLVDLETGADVLDWVDAGLVSASTTDLSSDEAGEIRIADLPEGRMTLSALGQVRTVDVIPGQVTEVVIQALP